MPTLANLFSITPPALPIGYCPNPPTWQQVANDLFNGAQITALVDTGNYQYNYGPTTPTVDNRLFPWLNTNEMRWYVFQLGMWISAYWPPPSSSVRILWVGTEPDLVTFDGGDTNPLSITSGAFWVADHNFDFRMPLGPGTSPAGTVVGVNGTGGEETHVLTEAELAAHYHPLTYNNDSDSGTGGCEQNYNTFMGGEVDGTLFVTQGISCSATVAAATVGSDTAHNNMPPYYGAFIIKRTLRAYYAIPG